MVDLYSAPRTTVVRQASIRRRQRMAVGGLVCIVVFVLALLALHAASLREPPTHMSQFANSRFGLFWLLAIYSLIVGSSVLVLALKPCLHDCRSKRVGLWLLGVAWFGAVVLASFPTDAFRPATLPGIIHDDAALTTFVLLGAAMVVLAPALRATPSLERFATVSFALGILVTVSWIVYLLGTLRGLPLAGTAQRVLVALIVAWFILLALRLRQPMAPPVLVAAIRRKSNAGARRASSHRAAHRLQGPA